MHTPIYVQPSIGIPAGPIGDSGSTGKQATGRKPIAAVIRPMPRQTGKQGSLRMDPADSNTSAPHVRKNNLDDYVDWLRKKYQQDKQDTKPETTLEVETEVVADGEPTEANGEESNGTVVAPASNLKPISLEFPSVFTTQDTFYSLLTHQHTNSISTESILNTETVNEPESKGADAHEASEVDEPEAKRFAPAKFTRVDSEHVIKKDMSSAHVSFQKTAEEAEATSTPLTISSQDTDAFIKTVSQAIASVLTETPEPAFEQKIREHFETELHARAISSLGSMPDNDEVDQMDRTPLSSLERSGGKPVLTMQSEAEKVAREILSDAQKEIPTNIAAWDVEDFRWPIVTNQMIVSGGTSIDRLTRSVMDMVSPGSQRIAITGLSRGEGTTSIAISLARWAAASGNNVLLVDADITRPSLSSQVGLASNLSWINAISQPQPPAEVIVRSQSSNLCIMPLADMVSRVTWPRFIYDNLGDLVDQVRSHFDVVILDMGPASQLLNELSRPELLLDATLLVHDGVGTSEFTHTKTQLEAFGIKKFVVAQNRAKQKSANVA